MKGTSIAAYEAAEGSGDSIKYAYLQRVEGAKITANVSLY